MLSSVSTYDSDLFNLTPDLPEKDVVSSFNWIYVEPGDSPAALETKEGQIHLETRDMDTPLLMSESFLAVKFEIKTDADADIDGNLAYMNGDGFHAFRDMELYAGDSLIQRYRYPGQVSTALTATEYSKSELERASQELFYIDEPPTDTYLPTAGPVAAGTNDNIIKAGAYNAVTGPYARAGGYGALDINPTTATNVFIPDSVGAQKRLARCGASKQFSVKLPLAKIFKFYQSNTGSKPPKGLKWSLNFSRNSDGRALCTVNGQTDAKFRIKSLRWWMPRIKPRLEDEIKLNKLLATNTSIPLNWLVVHEHIENEENYNAATSITINFRPVNRPRRIMLFAQNTQRYTFESLATASDEYAIKGNAGVFDNLGISYAQAFINGKEVNLRPYRQTFDIDTVEHNKRRDTSYTELPTRAYSEFVDYCGGPECETAISYDTWRRSYPIFTWIVDYDDDINSTKLDAWDVRIELEKEATAAYADATHNKHQITVLSFGEAISSYTLGSGKIAFNKH